MHAHMPDQKDNLAALAQHKPQTQAKYYRVHDKVSETNLGRRAVKNLVSLKTVEVPLPEKDQVTTPAPWDVEETDDLKMFSNELETGAIEEENIHKKLTGTSFVTNHSIKAVVLKLRCMREEFAHTLEPPSEQLTNTEKVMKFLDGCQTFAPSTSKALSVSSESSRFWRKFMDEQTCYLLKLTEDLVANNTAKKETVWQRVINHPRAMELGLISGKEDDEEIQKAKQRLTDKVRQGAKKKKWSQKK